MIDGGRIPYFSFQNREYGIDPEKSAELGYDVPRIRTCILITPHGHKGEPMEFIADEFIKRKKEEVRQGRYLEEWVKEYEKGFEAYKAGKELPRSGTPVMTWERLTKARRDALATIFPTLEDLASVPDASLDSIGLDGRVIRDLAKGDIQAKKDLSPLVKELANANELNRQLQERIANLEEQSKNRKQKVEA